MFKTKEYHRPQTLAEALALLRRPGIVTAPLAGGSWLAPRLHPGVPGSVDDQVEAVVDLADLGLDYITRQAAGQAALRLGATATLADLVESADCQQLAGGLLTAAARREGPLNLRNVATVGGCVVRANLESELLLALLALAAQVVIDDGQARELPLLGVLADRPGAVGQGLIVEVRVPWPAPGAAGALARVARTPSDHPIVAAAAVADAHSARVALGGVASTPLLLRLGHPAELDRALETALAGADTPDDFRGSADYRRAMAPVIARRALQGCAAAAAP